MARCLGLDAPSAGVPEFPRGTGGVLTRAPALKGLSLEELFTLWLEAARFPGGDGLAGWDEKLLRGTEIMYGDARRRFQANYGSRADGDLALLVLTCYLLRRSFDLRDLRLLNLALKNVDAIGWAVRPKMIARRLRSADGAERLAGAAASCALLGITCLTAGLRDGS